MLFPSILIFTETEDHYLVEFLGAQKKYEGLEVKKRSQPSTQKYLSQFEFDEETNGGVFELGGRGHGFKNISLSHDNNKKSLEERFPSLNLFESRLQRVGGGGSLIDFHDSFRSAFLEDCFLVNQKQNLYRCKHILFLSITEKEMSSYEYGRFLDEIVNQKNHKSGEKLVAAVHTVGDYEARKKTIAGQLQSLYLHPDVIEPTIGGFIANHPDILTNAFDADGFHHEVYLRWMDSQNKNSEKYIKPDLMVKRKDGYYDIFDLKTALLDKKNITTGGRKRRKFISYVEKGAAQLAHYEFYFEFDKNRKYAKSEYGIEVNNPRKVLVVGSFENVEPQQVDEACRRYDGIDIIDYDTLISMFMS